MTECWQYDRSFEPAVCDSFRALVEAHGSEDALDQWDWRAEQLYPNLCTWF
jgi:hypothetical protein